MKLTLLFILGCILGGCSNAIDAVSDSLQSSQSGGVAEAAGDPAEPPSSAMSYGIDGTLNEQDLTTLMYLDFSGGHSYQSIKGRFGFAAYTQPNADFYHIEGTSHWVRIDYNADGRATGYRFSDSQ